MHAVVVREVETRDLDELAELVNLCYRANVGWTNEHGLVAGERTNARDLLTCLQSPDTTTILVAISDEKRICGSILIQKSPALPKRWSFGMITVHPEEQKRGLGTRLLEAAADHVTALDGANCVIEITVMRPRTELIAWYERRKFTTQHDLPGIAFPPPSAGVGTALVPNLDFIKMQRQL